MLYSPSLQGGGWGVGLSFAFAQPKSDYPALRQRLQRGNYAEALAGYEELATK